MTLDLALTGIALGLFLEWLIAVLIIGRWREIHHGWALLPALAYDVPTWLRIVCLIVGLDDAIQHTVQAWQLGQHGRYTFLSPLHRFGHRLGLY